MKEIIAPVDRELLKSELTPDKRLRSTNKSNNEIYSKLEERAEHIAGNRAFA